MPSLDALASGSFTALGLCGIILALFVHGDIVPGALYRVLLAANADLREALKELAAAIGDQNRIENAKLEWEKEQSLRRRGTDRRD